MRKNPKQPEGAKPYPINPESWALRQSLVESQGVARGEVITYAGRLLLGVRRDGNIYDKVTGKLIGIDLYAREIDSDLK
jgi:hypothetical protein